MSRQARAPTGGVYTSKRDALGERKVAREVHRRGLPAHVRAPRVRARLAAAARLLLPAEGAADLGPARADVDVRDAAVRSGGCEEALGLAEVGREDRRREALGHAILEGDRLVEVAVAEDVEDGGEGLLRDDAALRRHPHDRRLRVPRVGPAVGERATAAHDELPALVARAADRGLHAPERLAGHEGADERPAPPAGRRSGRCGRPPRAVRAGRRRRPRGRSGAAARCSADPQCRPQRTGRHERRDRGRRSARRRPRCCRPARGASARAAPRYVARAPCPWRSSPWRRRAARGRRPRAAPRDRRRRARARRARPAYRRTGRPPDGGARSWRSP